MLKRVPITVILTVVATVMIGLASGLSHRAPSEPAEFLEPRVVSAQQSCVDDPNCSTGNEVVAAVYSRHLAGMSDTIEPKQATSYDIVAVYSSTTAPSGTDCDCDIAAASLLVNVTFDEVNDEWDVSECISRDFAGAVTNSTNCSSFASPFMSVEAVEDSICNTGVGAANSTGYRLRIGLAESVSAECSSSSIQNPTYYPLTVRFHANHIAPQGRRIASLCSEQGTDYVRTRAESQDVFDSGPFECVSNSNAGGIPALVFKYKVGTSPTITPSPTPTNTPTPTPTP